MREWEIYLLQGDVFRECGSMCVGNREGIFPTADEYGRSSRLTFTREVSLVLVSSFPLSLSLSLASVSPECEGRNVSCYKNDL